MRLRNTYRMPLAVLFDLDDTLLVDEEEVDAAFLSVTAVIDREFGAEEGALARSVRDNARRLWRAGPHHATAKRLGISSWEGLAADFTGRHSVLDALAAWIPSYRSKVWSASLEAFGAGDRAGELAAAYRRRRRSRYRLFPDALGVIAELRARGLRIGVVTNGPPDLQREKLEMTGLFEVVDAVAISGEIGVGKPDSAIFETVLEALDVAPKDAVMIGDSVERDMYGADAVGMASVWRTSSANDERMVGRPTIRSLSGLLVTLVNGTS